VSAPAARPRRRVPLSVKLTALGLSFLVTLLILEIGLRVFGFSATPVEIQIGHSVDARQFHVFEDANFEYHPELIWGPRAGHSVFNAQGFRGEELPAAKAPGAIRIFTVGDSNTLGWAGADGAHWPGDLQMLARRENPDVTVVNAGIWGYASFQGLRRFRQTLAYDPDIVLVSFGSNDAHLVREPDKDYEARSLRHSAFGAWLQNFRLGELALSAIDGASLRSSTLGPRVSVDDYKSNLRAMAAEAKARGIAMVILTRPYIGRIENEYWWKNRGADYSVAALEVAESEGLTFVDVYSYFKAHDDLFADESHFTGAGHRIAAAFILDFIRPLIAGRK
jgi:lysophospholipase L1-like esterase